MSETNVTRRSVFRTMFSATAAVAIPALPIVMNDEQRLIQAFRGISEKKQAAYLVLIEGSAQDARSRS